MRRKIARINDFPRTELIFKLSCGEKQQKHKIPPNEAHFSKPAYWEISENRRNPPSKPLFFPYPFRKSSLAGP